MINKIAIIEDWAEVRTTLIDATPENFELLEECSQEYHDKRKKDFDYPAFDKLDKLIKDSKSINTEYRVKLLKPEKVVAIFNYPEF